MSRHPNIGKFYQYESKWEEKLAKGVMKDYEYHPDPIAYTKPATDHTYRPDWKVEGAGEFFGYTLYVEAKGRFREMSEAKKYIHVRESLEECEGLIFLFQKPHVALPGAKPRKNGTKRSHAEWAEANGFKWYSEDTIDNYLRIIRGKDATKGSIT